MENANIGFAKGRVRSLKFAFKGAYLLLKTEHSIITQSFLSLCFIVAGFYYGISKTEWLFQILGTGLVLTAESLNTAVEKLCDFIHPDYHQRIGFIKDISAGAITFAVFTALAIICIIYSPYLYEKFI